MIVALISGLIDQAERIASLLNILTGEITDADLQELRQEADSAHDGLSELADKLRGGTSG